MITALQEYYNKRIKEVGLTKETNKRIISFEGRPQSVPIIGINEKSDALSIPYCDPSGDAAMYQEGNKTKLFERLRYRIPRTWKDSEGKEKTQRYSQPPRTGVYTYMTPGIVEAYKKAEKIDTLFIVEGELKAIAGDIAGLNIIGIGGIQNIKDKENNQIDYYITLIMERLTPDNVVLLFDADCLSIKYKEKEDLSLRLRNFYNSICAFRELMKAYSCDLYFAHIDEKFVETAKGLDDLLFSQNQEGKEKIVKELTSLSVGKKSFVKFIPLIAGSDRKLSRYFSLTGASEFYETYKHIIQDKEFNYQGSNYYFDGEKLTKTFYQQAKLYIRVGCDFYKKVWKINLHKESKHQTPIMVLRPWSIGEINRDFGDNKKFIGMIPKYDQFVNLPCNTKDYRRIIQYVHEGITTYSYNLYNELNHTITPGDFPTIKQFLRHIFSAKNTAGDSLYEFGLDYIQITFFNPTQKLPVLCFVSKERNTGKSTFLQFMRLIFQENTAILDNERFTGKFTSHFVHKLVVALDEGFIPIEQKLMKERIKNYSTGQTQWLEGKGKDANEIDNFMHLILCSNDENNFMQIDEGENRFAVIKVPTLPFDDPKILQKLEKEVGHFLHFLSHRKLFYETGKSRFSFDTKIYETEILKKVQERTMNKVHKEIRQYITDCFIKYDAQILKFAPVDLAREISSEGSFRISKSDVADYLKYELNMVPCPYGRYDLWHLKLNECGEFVAEIYGSKPGTPYEFHREDFVKEDTNQLK